MNAFTNQMNQGYYMGPMGGVQPMGYTPQPNMLNRPAMSNPLTDEQRKLLATAEDSFDLKIKPEEIAKAVCTHKNTQQGVFEIVPNNNPEQPGLVTCKICHATFNPDVVNEQYVHQAIDMVLNVLQTCKLIGVDLNDEVIRQYFTIIPLIERIPKLYKLVNNSFKKYNDPQALAPQNGPNMMGMYNAMVNPAVPMGMPGYGYGMGFGQPMQPTPMMNMQSQMVNGGNPLYQQPMQPQMQAPFGQQQMGGYGQPMNQPVMNQQQVAPQQNTQAQPAAGEQVNIKEQVKL